MTEEQTAWLKAHPEYQPIGFGRVYAKRGTLKPDGTFVPVSKAYPVKETGGNFGVGVPGQNQAAGGMRPDV